MAEWRQLSGSVHLIVTTRGEVGVCPVLSELADIYGESVAVEIGRMPDMKI